MAVTKAYRDRDRSDNLAMKVDRVMRIQQERMQSRQIVAAYKVKIFSYIYDFAKNLLTFLDLPTVGKSREIISSFYSCYYAKWRGLSPPLSASGGTAPKKRRSPGEPLAKPCPI